MRVTTILLDFGHALFLVGVVFFLQLRAQRAAIKVARLVLAGEEFVDRPLVFDVDDVGPVKHFCTRCGGMKMTPVRSPKTTSPGSTAAWPDVYGDVDSRHDHSAHGRRMRFAKVDLRRQVVGSLQVAYGSVDDSAFAGSSIDRRRQVVAPEVMSRSRAITSTTGMSPFCKTSMTFWVGRFDIPFGLGVGVNKLLEIGTQRQVLRRDSASDQCLAGFEDLKIARELTHVTLAPQHSPRLLQSTAWRHARAARRVLSDVRPGNARRGFAWSARSARPG